LPAHRPLPHRAFPAGGDLNAPGLALGGRVLLVLIPLAAEALPLLPLGLLLSRAFLFAALLEALLLDIPQEVRVIVRPLRPRLLIELLILPTAQLAYCRRVAAARPEGLPQHHDRDDDQDQDNEATQGCDAPSRQKNSAKCLPSTLATSWG